VCSGDTTASDYERIKAQDNYCKCVIECETCVGNNGGCGNYDLSSGPALTSLFPYHSLWGTCTGSCQPMSSLSTPAPQDDKFSCSVPTTSAVPLPDWNHCLPQCVDCLAKARAKQCDQHGNGCRTISPTRIRARDHACAWPGYSFSDYFFDDPLNTHQWMYAGNLHIDVRVPIIDWRGRCANGTCKICTRSVSVLWRFLCM